MTKWIKGSDMPQHLQTQALARFAYRYTREHVPAWAKQNNKLYPVQFASDADWLANTDFAVVGTGPAMRFNEKTTSCQSRPTWPDGQQFTDSALGLQDAKSPEPFNPRIAS